MRGAGITVAAEPGVRGAAVPKVAGLDGCRRGWVVVTTGAALGAPCAVRRITDLGEVMGELESGDLATVGVDIPIGLPDVGPRRCDVEARIMVGPRRASVFPAPLRAMLGATTYEEAAGRGVALSGKSLSRQAYGILSKVGEMDRVMTPDRQDRVVEVHPEVSFTAMTGRPMAYAKRCPAGRAERLAALRAVFPDVDGHADGRVRGASPDDVLDAFAVAWSARRWLAGEHLRLGGDCDRRGLRMEIIA